MSQTKHTFALTFRGEPVRLLTSGGGLRGLVRDRKTSWQTVYDVQYVVLHYRFSSESFDFIPSVLATYKTEAVARREAKARAQSDRYHGQTFVVGPIKPGTHEVVDLPVVEPVQQSMDSHGNMLAQEGVDRCICGAKYWEGDRCVDCGTHVLDIRATQEA